MALKSLRRSYLETTSYGSSPLLSSSISKSEEFLMIKKSGLTLLCSFSLRTTLFVGNLGIYKW